MSDSAAWQSGNAELATGGATQPESKSMISANSFRALTAKLKKPAGAETVATIPTVAVQPTYVQTPVSQVVPQPEFAPQPEFVPQPDFALQTEFVPPIEPAMVSVPSQSRLVETVVIQSPSVMVEPAFAEPAFTEPAFTEPVLAAPAQFEITSPPVLSPVAAPNNEFAPPVRTPVAAPAPQELVASTFRIDTHKPIPASTLLQDDDDIETSVLEDMADRAQTQFIETSIEEIAISAPAGLEAEIVVETLPEIMAPLPEIFEPPVSQIEEKFVAIESPAQPKFDVSDVRRREATFAELDLIARMVYSKPTVEDRKQYLKEVSELDEAEKFASLPLSPSSNLAKDEATELEMDLAPVPVLPPEPFFADTAEDVPFLSDDLASGFDPEQHKPAELIASSEAPHAFPTIDAPSALTSAPQADSSSRLLPKVTALPHMTSGSGDVEAHGQLMSDQEAGELARTLLDMMASSTSGGLPQERALAADTLLRLYPRVPVKPLMMLSERLAIMDNPPNLLVGKVIRDPRIEIAGPLLENSPHVPDQELLDVIAENDPAKLRLIARRRKLSRAISDRLVQVNDPSVHLTLVRNSSAEISHNGFLALTEAARTETDIMAPLTTRADISPPFAFELFWMAPSQLRRYILNRFLTDSETLNKILKITMATQGQVEFASDGNPVIASVLEALQLAMAGKLPEAADMMSGPVRICTAAAERILGDQLGEPLAVMLKAIGFPRNDLVQLLMMLQSSEFGLIERERDTEELLSIFDKLSFNKARILLTYWDWAATRSGPYAPIH
jgi:hypothetical protein